MSILEKMITDRLSGCSFLPGSFDKKFVRQLSDKRDQNMTAKGRAQLLKLFAKYHGQVSDFEEMCNEILRNR